MEQTLFLLINHLGDNMYAAIFTAMLLTGIGVPFPGELTLGFTGYLIYMGQIKPIGAIVAATLGDLLGAMIGYSIGIFSRTTLVTRYFSFLLPTPAKLAAVSAWLEKYGIFAIVFGRLLPIIRGAVTIPAGFLHMNTPKYIIGNTISSVIWCSVLIYAGITLGYNWNEIAGWGRPFAMIAAGGVIVVLLAYLIGKWAKSKIG